MNKQVLLGDPLAIKTLAERLSKCPEVTRYDRDDEKEAWTLAYSFADLEASFLSFLNEQLPKLISQQGSSSEVFDTLLEIGEGFRHILYHIHDPKFYGYLKAGPESDDLPATQI